MDRPRGWELVRILFDGFGLLIGAVNLALLADEGRLLTTPFRRDWWNGPGLGAFLLISGSLGLWRAFRKARGGKPEPPPA